MDSKTQATTPPTPSAEPTATPASPPAAESRSNVVAAPAQTPEELAEAQEAAAGQQQVPPTAPPQLNKTKPTSSTSADTKLAIIATVVIVIGLGVLATLAYLHQK